MSFKKAQWLTALTMVTEHHKKSFKLKSEGERKRWVEVTYCRISVMTQHVSDRIRRGQHWAKRAVGLMEVTDGASDDDSGEDPNIEGSDEDNFASDPDKPTEKPKEKKAIIRDARPHVEYQNKVPKANSESEARDVVEDQGATAASEDQYEFGFDQESRLGAYVENGMAIRCPQSVQIVSVDVQICPRKFSSPNDVGMTL